MHHIPAHTKLKVTLLLFFSNIFCPKSPQARALHLIFSCVLFYILFVFVFCDLFVRNCLGLERQTCFSPQALAALAPPKPGFGSHGSCLRQPANPLDMPAERQVGSNLVCLPIPLGCSLGLGRQTCFSSCDPRFGSLGCCLSQLGNLRSKTIVYIRSVSAHHDLG